jgi:hypothetical protein
MAMLIKKYKTPSLRRSTTREVEITYEPVLLHDGFFLAGSLKLMFWNKPGSPKPYLTVHLSPAEEKTLYRLLQIKTAAEETFQKVRPRKKGDA